MLQNESSRWLLKNHNKNNFTPVFSTILYNQTNGAGTGLALSLSYDIVKAHGGELKVSTKAGEGSIFIVEIRLA